MFGRENIHGSRIAETVASWIRFFLILRGQLWISVTTIQAPFSMTIAGVGGATNRRD